MPLERMLRIYFLQPWFNPPDPVVEEALYDSEAMRGFADIDLGQEAAPDETTVCRFRHLLEHRGMGKTLFTAINRYLHENRIKIAEAVFTGDPRSGIPADFCPQFPIAPSMCYENKAQERDPKRFRQHHRRDERLAAHIRRVWQENFCVCGSRKAWKQLNRGTSAWRTVRCAA